MNKILIGNNYRMRLGLITLILSFTNLYVIAQQKILLEATNLKTIIAYEDSIGSDSKKSILFNPYDDNDFIELFSKWHKVNNRAFIYSNKNDNFYPNLHTWYYSDKDSIIRLVLYNWDLRNIDLATSNEEFKKQTTRFDEYKTKYTEVKSKLTNLLGTPMQNDLENENNYEYLIKSVWDFKDKKVVLRLIFDKQIKEVYDEFIKKTLIYPHTGIEMKIVFK